MIKISACLNCPECPSQSTKVHFAVPSDIIRSCLTLLVVTLCGSGTFMTLALIVTLLYSD